MKNWFFWKSRPNFPFEFSQEIAQAEKTLLLKSLRVCLRANRTAFKVIKHRNREIRSPSKEGSGNVSGAQVLHTFFNVNPVCT